MSALVDRTNSRHYSFLQTYRLLMLRYANLRITTYLGTKGVRPDPPAVRISTKFENSKNFKFQKCPLGGKSRFGIVRTSPMVV